jgi:hypothetical protein
VAGREKKRGARKKERRGEERREEKGKDGERERAREEMRSREMERGEERRRDGEEAAGSCGAMCSEIWIMEEREGGDACRIVSCAARAGTGTGCCSAVQTCRSSWKMLSRVEGRGAW